MTSRRTEILVGAFTLAALTALILLTLNLQRTKWFQQRHELILYFADVSGLNVGAPVVIHGVPAGNVRAILWEEHIREGQRYNVRVEADIAANIPVYRDAQARVLTAGLVGETRVNIRAGSPKAGVIEPGGELWGRVIPPLDEQLERLPVLVDNAEGILTSVRGVLDAPGAQEELRESIRNVRNFSERADRIAELMETELAETMSRVRSVGERAETTMAELDVEARATITEFRDTLSDVRTRLDAYDQDIRPMLRDARETFSKGVEIATNIAHRLGFPGTDWNLFFEKMAESSDHLEVILGRIRNGQGTVGRLMTDQSLYDASTDSLRAARSLLGGSSNDSALPAVQRTPPAAPAAQPLNVAQDPSTQTNEAQTVTPDSSTP